MDAAHKHTLSMASFSYMHIDYPMYYLGKFYFKFL